MTSIVHVGIVLLLLLPCWMIDKEKRNRNRNENRNGIIIGFHCYYFWSNNDGRFSGY
jgi:hypothetical protein